LRLVKNPGLTLLWISIFGFLLFSCKNNQSKREVVIYTSVDQVFSEPILTQFEEETGIHVLPVYDVEAAKTTGLVNRLIAEKDHPQADVFWSGEFAQTILLKDEGVLVPYLSPNRNEIPPRYMDPEGFWTGVGGRARVIIVNTDLVPLEETPNSIYDLLEPKWSASQIGIAYPLFGTTSTQAAALYALLGPDDGRAYFKALQERGVQVLDGNSVVRDLVASGRLAFGLTDTDDACGAIENGAPVSIVFPDQGEGSIGTLIIPNTLGLIADSPHPEEGKALIDYLLSKEAEEAMILSGWSHIALRPLEVEQSCLEYVSIRGMDVTLIEVYEQFERVKSELTTIFIR
jgi:iron(III) transport system substrate-binding protein